MTRSKFQQSLIKKTFAAAICQNLKPVVPGCDALHLPMFMTIFLRDYWKMFLQKYCFAKENILYCNGVFLRSESVLNAVWDYTMLL